MTPERKARLERDPKARLTHDEQREGWHFCNEFDGLLTQGEVLAEDGDCICGFKKHDPSCSQCQALTPRP